MAREEHRGGTHRTVELVKQGWRAFREHVPLSAILLGLFTLTIVASAYAQGVPANEPLNEYENMASECGLSCTYERVHVPTAQENIREYLCSVEGPKSAGDIAQHALPVAGEAARLMSGMEDVQSTYDPWPPKYGGTVYWIEESDCGV